MFLTGREAAYQLGLRGLPAESVQPAGVDLSVAEVEVFEEPGFLGVGERRIPAGRRLECPGGVCSLAPGTYRVRFREVVEVPLWAVGFCYPRSSLLRMGAALHCAVWDPGYRGRGQALLAVFNPHGLRLELGSRVAQLVLARLEGLPEAGYRGAYQGEGLEGRPPET
ncbi:deoxyuridine 5'-triphosphate nucleotidohydrolase [Stetteria hydrogenophila]